MAKRYIRLNWQDRPSVATPLNAANLNRMDKGIDDIDNAVEDLYNIKFDKANIANNVITTAAGLALDARQGKSLQDQITEQNNNLAAISYIGYLEPGQIIDFNIATTFGYYRVALEFAESTHPPDVVTGGPSYGMLEVKVAPNAAWIWQIYYPTNSADIYIRSKANEGEWIAWVLK